MSTVSIYLVLWRTVETSVRGLATKVLAMSQQPTGMELDHAVSQRDSPKPGDSPTRSSSVCSIQVEMPGLFGALDHGN